MSAKRRLPRGRFRGMLSARKDVATMNTYETGATIKALRERRNLTQAVLAGKIGVSSKTVSKWETGVSQS